MEKFKFTGLNIQQKDGAIFIDQDDYVKSIEPIANEKVGNQNEKLPLKKFKEYRRLTGQLSWAAENTRPDISYDVRELSTRNKSATYDDLKVANKVLSIRFSGIGLIATAGWVSIEYMKLCVQTG